MKKRNALSTRHAAPRQGDVGVRRARGPGEHRAVHHGEVSRAHQTDQQLIRRHLLVVPVREHVLRDLPPSRRRRAVASNARQTKGETLTGGQHTRAQPPISARSSRSHTDEFFKPRDSSTSSSERERDPRWRLASRERERERTRFFLEGFGEPRFVNSPTHHHSWHRASHGEREVGVVDPTDGDVEFAAHRGPVSRHQPEPVPDLFLETQSRRGLLGASSHRRVKVGLSCSCKSHATSKHPRVSKPGISLSLSR